MEAEYEKCCQHEWEKNKVSNHVIDRMLYRGVWRLNEFWFGKPEPKPSKSKPDANTRKDLTELKMKEIEEEDKGVEDSKTSNSVEDNDPYANEHVKHSSPAVRMKSRFPDDPDDQDEHFGIDEENEFSLKVDGVEDIFKPDKLKHKDPEQKKLDEDSDEEIIQV